MYSFNGVHLNPGHLVVEQLFFLNLAGTFHKEFWFRNVASLVTS